MSFRHKYGTTTATAAVVTVALLVVDKYSDDVNIAKMTLEDGGVRAAVFGALIALAALILSVTLGVLAMVTTLEERPIVKLMKKLNRFEELVHGLVGPIKLVFVLFALSVVCILVPGKNPGLGESALVAFTVAFAVGLMVQTARIGTLIASVLLHRPDGPGAAETPQAARARMRPVASDDDDGLTKRESVAVAR